MSLRSGYQADFLGGGFEIDVPKPGLALEGDVLQPPGLPQGEVVVPYINYSLVMSKSTRQALYSAANVNNDPQKVHQVSGSKGRRWFIDDRVGRDNQLPNYSYQGSMWDRGHLTRRTAVTWGDSLAIATAASNDSCAYTNACMQHKNFNEDEWRAVELLVSEFKVATRITVFTGPVFTITDRFFIKQFGDDPVRIPAAFWKTVSYVAADNALHTEAYIFFQDVPSIRSSKARGHLRIKNMQVTTTELSLWTGLVFPQVMYDSNLLKFYSGPERISTKRHKELLKKDPDTLQLEAGITGENAISAARTSFPLEDFYELIDEISWV